jgi:O-antigen ligase/Tfp pilus assembly protein PilF
MKHNKTEAQPKIIGEQSKPFSISDYVAMLSVILFLSMDFISAYRSIDILGTQYLYMSILNLIFGLYWFFNKDLMSQGFLYQIKKPFYIKCYAIFLIMGLLSVIKTNNVSLWIVNFAQIVIVAITILNFILLFNQRKRLFFNIVFFVSIAAFVKSFSELYNFFQILKTSGLNVASGQMKGNTGNVNIFSATLNMKMVFLIIGVLYFNDWKKWFAAIGLLLCTITILFLDSRATFLAIFLEIVAVLIYLLINKYNAYQRISQAALIVLPIIFGTLFSLQVIKSNTAKAAVFAERYKTTATSNATSIDFKDGGSADSRLKYWKNGGNLALKNPLLGVGLGNYRIESLPYERLDFNNLLVSQHTHNDFLEISAETGVLGGIAYLLIFISIFYINIKNLLKTTDHESKLIYFATILLTISYGIDSFFNFPLHRPSVQLFFGLMIVFSFVNSFEIANNQAAVYSKKLSILVLFFSVITLFCAWETFNAFTLENDITADSMIKEDLLNSDIVKKRMPMFPNVFSNSEPFSEQLAIYLVNEKKYAESQKYFNEANKINPYNGRVEWYKHRVAKETNKKDSAYYYAKKAFEVRPRNYDYFVSMLFMANEFKDTTQMLKTHEVYNSFVKTPKNWIDTSNALHLSNFNKKNILSFIERGLIEFPNDSILLERKKVFEYELNAEKPGATFAISSKKPVSATEKYLYFLQRAINYGSKNQFDKALECYKEVQKNDPTNLTILQNIGICYFKLNQFQKAIVALEKVLTAPALQDGKTEYILGISYFNIKNKEKGCKYLKIASAKNFAGAQQVLQQNCK